jgi:hypothetical protein
LFTPCLTFGRDSTKSSYCEGSIDCQFAIVVA